jgi:hypothetical protein
LYSSCFQNVLGELPQGKGETYWFVHGHLIHSDHGYMSKDSTLLLRSRIAELGAALRKRNAEGA